MYLIIGLRIKKLTWMLKNLTLRKNIQWADVEPLLPPFYDSVNCVVISLCICNSLNLTLKKQSLSRVFFKKLLLPSKYMLLNTCYRSLNSPGLTLTSFCWALSLLSLHLLLGFCFWLCICQRLFQWESVVF